MKKIQLTETQYVCNDEGCEALPNHFAGLKDSEIGLLLGKSKYQEYVDLFDHVHAPVV